LFVAGEDEVRVEEAERVENKAVKVAEFIGLGSLNSLSIQG